MQSHIRSFLKRSLIALTLAGTLLTTGQALAELKADGWRVLVVWECALKGRTRLPIADVIESCGDWLRSDRPALQIAGLV